MKLSNLDLNLLVSLDALLQQRGVTRAAHQLGLSQPALSASLARLRRHFGDDLLARSGNDYQLTPLAVQLKPQVTLALRGVERVFTAQPDFVPADSTREFSLVISDYAVRVLGDTLAGLLAEAAPMARLRFGANTPEMVDRAAQTLLATDGMVMPHGFVTDLPHVDLYRDEWVCVVSADNTDVGEELTLEALTTMPWVASYQGPTSATPAARQLRHMGIEPRVQVITESFLTVPALVAGTGRIALMQQRLVQVLPLSAGVRALPCPFDVGPLVEALWWLPVYDRDPEHLFFRELVVQAARLATLPAQPSS
ncbi:LysR family transcriptional regulator [Modestobacter sp. I12A-02628]|uniref:LysR family transcriptional regulator n=1 Tax=Goekera deserti TaxID=2497753 RepID=A0A7K3WBU1_9ACTN|nr:LysR family transcriptional regulator [Goekera deserti]MPQ99115.1 LysR family transcriptional regulator [Goekera deserti]NDI47449.1 LysR family transcriptional regulator [Goekera deserti]NEL53260.1 LysR family transcriptional regulator [Goekera deserti]